MNFQPYQVEPIAAFNDNYIWLLTVPDSDYCVVVDPGDGEVVLELLKQRQLILAAILITHHHQDHIGGVTQLIDNAPKHPEFKVFGPTIEAKSVVDIALTERDTVSVNAMNIQLKVLDLPGHTLGHIAYYDEFSVFCGDTLFAGGCGRMFEGTPAQMHASLAKLAALHPHTYVYCAHEYTLANLAFAQTVEPHNEAITSRIAYCEQLRLINIPTVPSKIRDELATNPFMRTSNDDVIAMLQSKSKSSTPINAIEAFAQLRQWKDNF